MIMCCTGPDVTQNTDLLKLQLATHVLLNCFPRYIVMTDLITGKIIFTFV